MKKLLNILYHNEDGITLLGYVLACAVVAVVTIVLMQSIGDITN